MTTAGFDVLAVPLDGIQAIEASAGSGKTHALVGLYLRAVLEAGLGVESIAAVTFTDAATAELAERIVQRLDGARRWFDGIGADTTADAALLEAAIARVGTRARVRARLGAALAQIDRITVLTLHGYARRALAAEAWQAGDLRDRRPVDGSRARAEAARDCLRRWDAEDPARALRLRRACGGAQALARLATELTAVRPLGVLPPDPEGALAAATAELARRGTAIASALGDDAVESLRQLLAGHPALTQDARDGYTPARVDAMCEALRRWRAAPHEPLPGIVDALHPQAIRDARGSRGRGIERPVHPLLERLAPLIETSAEVRRLTAAADLWVAWRAIEEGAARREDARNEAGHDRVIQLLHDRLGGAGGAALAAALGARHRLLLVDEFQDTDPLQFGILERVRAGAPGGLVLIGDPKQAIYGFRGGDVHAWRRALQRADAAVHRIATNWRSTPRLVDALNLLFARPGVFGLDFVHYTPAMPAARAHGPGLEDPIIGAPFVFLSGASPTDAPATVIAAELGRLLADPGVRLAGRALRAADCAVLVRRHRDAIAVAEALAAHGIPAARIAGEDLLDGEAAQEWRRWLAALAEPADPGRLRAALAGPSFGLDAGALARLDAEPAADARERERWRDWRGLLLDRGLEAVTVAICGHVAPGLLARADGAGLLDRLRQLGQWLATAEAGLHDPAALLARLERACLRGGPEEEGVRAAAAVPADAVRVLTIHAAKGLEFPLVFVHGLDARPRARAVAWARVHDSDGNAHVDLGSASIREHHAAAAADAAAEERRLAYVALTRAIHRLSLVMPAEASASRSVLADLLALERPGKRADDPLESAIAELVAAHPEQFASRRVDGSSGPHAHAVAARPPCAVRPRLRPPRVQRQYASYTSLVRRDDGDVRDHDRWLPAPGAREAAPGGRAFGDCFHLLMERVEPGTVAAAAAAVERLAAQRGLDAATRQELGRLLVATWDLRLSTGRSWREIAAGVHGREIGFAFRIDAGAAARVAACLQQAGLGELAARIAAGLSDRAGLIRGAIDAVYCEAERWHLVDWKTNRVGDDAGGAVLDRLMDEHAFRLQALIYQVALHRHLRQRLGPAYRPERHLGGADYVFVRRAVVPDAKAVVPAGLPPQAVVALDRAFGAMA